MGVSFRRVALVDRGTAAIRFLQAVSEWNGEHESRERLIAIALFQETDRLAPFVREAHESYCLGEAPEGAGSNDVPGGIILDRGALQRALSATRAEAVWAGWESAEQLALAEFCQQQQLSFIGPGIDFLRIARDPTAVSERARRSGIPPIEDHGLGAGSRRIEVHVLADQHGKGWVVGVVAPWVMDNENDDSRESPVPYLTQEQDSSLRESVLQLCSLARLRGAAVVQLAYHPQESRFFLVSLRPGLSVWHAVAEAVTGIDLIKLQIHIALGGVLEGAAPAVRGHAMAARLRTELPAFRPQAKEVAVEALRLPTGPGIRVDAGAREGEVLDRASENTIATVVSLGRTRTEARGRLHRALDETLLVVRGVPSNRPLLQRALQHSLATGTDSADPIEMRADGPGFTPSRRADVALVYAAIDAYEQRARFERLRFLSTAARGRAEVSDTIGQMVELRHQGQLYTLRVFALGEQRYRLLLDGRSTEVTLDAVSPREGWLTYAGTRHHLICARDGAVHRIETDSEAHEIHSGDAGVVRAPGPAVVLSILVRPGDRVVAGQVLLLLESMKTEMSITAPCRGRVRDVLVLANLHVTPGAALVQIEPDDAAESEPGGERVTLKPVPSENRDQGAAIQNGRAVFERWRALMLGYDIEPNEVRRSLDRAQELQGQLPAHDPATWRMENELLEIFVDISSLFRRPPALDDPDAIEAVQVEEYLSIYLRTLDAPAAALPAPFLAKVKRALAHYGVVDLQRCPALEQALVRLFKAQHRMDERSLVVNAILQRRWEQARELRSQATADLQQLLQRLIAVSHGRAPTVCELAREVRYRFFDQPLFEEVRERVYGEMEEHLGALVSHPTGLDRSERIAALVGCPFPLAGIFGARLASADTPLAELMLEVLIRRYYRIRQLREVGCSTLPGRACASGEYEYEGKRIHVVATSTSLADLQQAGAEIGTVLAAVPEEEDVVVDLYAWSPEPLPDEDATAQLLAQILSSVSWPRRLRRIVVVLSGTVASRGLSAVQHFTYRPQPDGRYAEECLYRGLHPMMGKRMHLWRLENFAIRRLPSVEDVYLFHAVARTNARDERLFAIAEVRDLSPVRDSAGRIVRLPHLERMLMEALAAIRRYQTNRPRRLEWNRVLLYVWPPLRLEPEELNELVHRMAPLTEGLGLEQVVARARIPDPQTGALNDTVLRISNPTGSGLMVTSGPPPTHPLAIMSDYERKVARLRQRGLPYPYEVIRLITPQNDPQAQFPPGDFQEYDLTANHRLVPVQRPRGENSANVVIGVIRNFTAKYPEGMARVIVLGDPSKAVGAIAEPECRRILAALDLAESMQIPLEWFAISAGAKISMESGTENMDWIARVIRRLVEYTQRGGEVNVIVNGINVGAQPYWNAEATMLLHTRGILIMTPQGAMVLTGKQALDYSGSVSAEDNLGIGGYDRIMGPNGQAQYWARDLTAAVQLLLHHYDHTYILPGERFPRQAQTSDPADRDVCQAPHGNGFLTVGEIFSAEKNPERKRPFEIRKVMQAVIDQDHRPLERWAAMRDAEVAVVWDAHLGGFPVCLIGIESRPLPRLGFVPADGPAQWTAGTLFPRASKKIARAINAASHNRPLVILANLSGFDGSPESMRDLQLEYGAEIGRAVVNFRGPIVFCVVSRYHGGAYVVFSGRLNEQVEAAAIEGSFASVIGGAPAAAVVFASEVEARTRKDARVAAIEQALAEAGAEGKVKWRAQLDATYRMVHSEKLGEVADEFDRVHNVQRALKVGSLDRIVAARELRPYLIDAVQRGMKREWTRAVADANAGGRAS